MVAQFFREPKRAAPADAGAILSPADGRVVFVGAAASPADDAPALKISIFMNVFNVHANRAPVSGEVIASRRLGGRFFNAALDKSSQHNERHQLTIRAAFGTVVSMQIAGLLARRILCYARVGDRLRVGQRYGFIRFGSRVDVYLPAHCRPAVAIGDKIYAGLDAIATPYANGNAV